MLKPLIDAVMLLFILLGIFFVCYIVFQKLLAGRKSKGFFVLVPGYPDDERLPEKVYSAFIEANLLNFIKVNEVVVLDFGISEKLKNECENLFGLQDNINFISADSFENSFKK